MATRFFLDASFRPRGRLRNDGADAAPYVIAQLVEHHASHLVQKLPEPARWVRAQKAPVERIAGEFEQGARQQDLAEKICAASGQKTMGRAA